MSEVDCPKETAEDAFSKGQRLWISKEILEVEDVWISEVKK